ncbi:response regulator [Mesorhizobium sp. 2RAF45]|uniref:response regulator n=1 Tax=Mesorhizobium sp. 2RAF45 TaxID=3233001 RepID=UPI003F9A4D4C
MGHLATKLRVLVIEDEAMVAFLVEDMLTEMGHEVAAVASRMQQGLDLARTGAFDLAIVDVNLDGQPSYPIADVLKERGISFVFATGYGSQGLDPAYVGSPVLAKPFAISDLQNLLLQLPVNQPRSGPPN